MQRSRRAAVNQSASQPFLPNSAAGPDNRPIPRMPRWVKLFATAAVVLILVFFVMHLTGAAPMGHGM